MWVDWNLKPHGCLPFMCQHWTWNNSLDSAYWQMVSGCTLPCPVVKKSDKPQTTLLMARFSLCLYMQRCSHARHHHTRMDSVAWELGNALIWRHSAQNLIGFYENVAQCAHMFTNTALIADSFLQRKTTASFPIRRHQEDTTHWNLRITRSPPERWTITSFTKAKSFATCLRGNSKTMQHVPWHKMPCLPFKIQCH